LEALGFSLRAAGGKILVAPPGRLSPAQRDAITAVRDELFAILMDRPAARALEDADEHLALAVNGLKRAAGRLEDLASAAPVARLAGPGFTGRWAKRVTDWAEQLDELVAVLGRVVKRKGSC
jgi:hypothetical protein